MNIYTKFHELPICDIRPDGWLRRYLEHQRDGLTGHIEAAGYPFNTGAWTDPAIVSGDGTINWGPYEQTAYWIDGAIRCGYLLGDTALIQRGLAQIDHVLNHADQDGYLGPAFMKNPVNWNRWPHVVLFRAMEAHYTAAHDERILPALTRHYLSGTSPHTEGREVCNVEPMLWAYEQTGDRRLLDLALQAYSDYNRRFPDEDTTLANLLSDRRATIHGVTFNEIGKLGAILYRYTGEQKYLEAAINGYRKLDRDQMLVDGVHSSTEQLHGKDPLDAHETCDIADYAWGAGHLLLTTGAADYADKIERACFNAAPGAVRSDFKALQYFSCPNQVIADASSCHPLFFRGSTWMSYRPNPGTECCPGDVNRIMPNYASRMWLNDGQGGLAAALYGPSQVSAKAGRDQASVTIVEKTAYPFSETILFELQAAQPVEFPLSLRIPGWCSRARLTINGQEYGGSLPAGSFVTLQQVFHPGDRMELTLPMEVRLQEWPHGGVSIERGPLVYSLGITENWQIDRSDQRSTADFPAWNLYPASRWNYALAMDGERLVREPEFIWNAPSDDPWSLETAPVALRVPARRVRNWTIQKKSRVQTFRLWADTGKFEVRSISANFKLTPQLPDPETLPGRLGKRLETITLVPYGCTHLRITIFPKG
ncbi:MAG: beta-L-arabinofuranosidase domain-containing protein [Omnitrophica WOR_2 bacterium]